MTTKASPTTTENKQKMYKRFHFNPCHNHNTHNIFSFFFYKFSNIFVLKAKLFMCNVCFWAHMRIYKSQFCMCVLDEERLNNQYRFFSAQYFRFVFKLSSQKFHVVPEIRQRNQTATRTKYFLNATHNYL